MESLGSLNILHNYKKNELFCNLAILTILFFLNCFMGELSYVAFSFLFLIVMITNMSNGFTYIVYSIPFCLVGGEISGFIFLATLASFMLKYYIKMIFFDKMRPDKKTVVFLAIFVAYLLLPLGEYNEQYLIKFIILIGLVLVLYLMTKYPKEFRIKINVNILALSLFLSVLCFGTYFISDYLRDLTILSYYDDIIRFQALMGNPNVLAMICQICLAILIYLIISSKISWVEVFGFIVFAAVGFSTMSKTFLILLSLMLVILLIYIVKKYPFAGICVITSICALILVFVIIKPQIFITYFSRFISLGENESDTSFDGVMNTITTHRYGIWMGYLQYLIQYPFVLFFGSGLGAKRIVGDSPHNIYISLLYHLGIVGVILLTTIVIIIYRNFRKKYPLQITKWIFIPIMIMCLLVCVEDLFMFIYV